MITFMLHWLMWNALLGGLLLTTGSLLTARTASPVRRLRLLQYTLIAALLAPILATAHSPWRWSLKWLPATSAARNVETETSFETPLPSAPEPRSLGGPALTDVHDADVVGVEPFASATASGSEPTESLNAVFTFTPRWSWRMVSFLAVGIHFAAMGVFAVWWLIGVIALFRIWRGAAPADVAVVQLLESLQRTSPSRRLQVRVAEQSPTALAFGLARWRILLPKDLVEHGSQEQLRFGLAHELAHLSQGDLWTWRLTRLAQLVCWFQPAYWWIRRQVRINQDFLADASAADTGSAVDFAAFLVSCTRHGQEWPAAAALPLSSRPSDLARRIKMLLKTDRPLERRCPLVLHAAGVSAVAIALTFAALVRVEAQDPKPASPDKDAPAAETQSASQNKQASAEKSANGETLTYQCRVVTHGTDAPIAGAKIRVERSLYGDPRYPKNHKIETTTHTTDADGYYTIVIPPEQSRERYLYIELDVEHPQHMAKRGFGYALGMIRRNERLGERPFFEMTKLYAAQPVTGRLVNPEGGPAANVEITGYQYPGDRPWDEDEGYKGSFFKERTDRNGSFSLPIATPGRAAFWFQPAGAAPLGVVAPEERGDIGEVELPAGFPVKGRVLDAEGKPVAGVKVDAHRQSSESPEIDEFNRMSAAMSGYHRSAETNDAGEFDLAPVESGTYEFRVAEYAKSGGVAQFPGVFVNQSVEVKEGSDPLEFRALPTVSITVKNVDSAGDPKRGFEFTAWGRLPEGKGWFAQQSTRPKSGVCVAQIPRALENVELSFMDNEHGSYRVRRKPEAELEVVRRIKLGTVDADVTGIEVVRYRAPVILVKAVDPDGNVFENVKVRAHLTRSDENSPSSVREELNFHFEKQQDGRWRSQQLLPDADVTVTVEKEGWKADPQQVSLAEGDEQELVFAIRSQ